MRGPLLAILVGLLPGACGILEPAEDEGNRVLSQLFSGAPHEVFIVPDSVPAGEKFTVTVYYTWECASRGSESKVEVNDRSNVVTIIRYDYNFRTETVCTLNKIVTHQTIIRLVKRGEAQVILRARDFEIGAPIELRRTVQVY